MTLLVLGLVLLMVPHSVRLLDAGLRDRAVSRLGAGPWKGLYSLVSLAGLALIVMGFGAARADSPMLWTPPAGLKHFVALLMLLSCILLVAAFVPGNHLKARMGHPMVLGVKTWAFAHLLANGRLVDVVLFGVFLAWSVALFISLRRADRVVGDLSGRRRGQGRHQRGGRWRRVRGHRVLGAPGLVRGKPFRPIDRTRAESRPVRDARSESRALAQTKRGGSPAQGFTAPDHRQPVPLQLRNGPTFRRQRFMPPSQWSMSAAFCCM